jgi:hypothetical protein
VIAESAVSDSGAQWLVELAPHAMVTGPMGALLRRMLPPMRAPAPPPDAPASPAQPPAAHRGAAAPAGPRDALTILSEKFAIELRESPDVLIAKYAESTFFAVRMPDGDPASTPTHALAERFLPPSGTTAPRADLVRVFGSLASGTRVSAASLGEPGAGERAAVFIAEAGKFGPVLVSIALATGKLARARSIAAVRPYEALSEWATAGSLRAPLVAMAACPLGAILSAPMGGPATSGAAERAPIVLTECDGVAAALSADDAGTLHLRVHVTGRWGKDTDAASRELRGVLERIVGSDLGRVLGLREGDRTLAKIDLRATGEAIDAELTGDGARVADGLRSLLADAAPGW